MPVRPAQLAVVLVVLAACGAPGHAEPAGRVLHAARWPDGADTYRASAGTGCLPRSMLQVCEVPEGSVMNADGSITTPAGRTVRCEPACAFSEYSLECRAAEAGAEVPLPAASLGCSVVPVPTPSAVLHYCCPGVVE